MDTMRTMVAMDPMPMVTRDTMRTIGSQSTTVTMDSQDTMASMVTMVPHVLAQALAMRTVQRLRHLWRRAAISNVTTCCRMVLASPKAGRICTFGTSATLWHLHIRQ